MSTIAVNAITDANGGSTTSINGTTPNAYNTVGKNLIINGAMQIAQRGTSASVTGSTYLTCDRWRILKPSAATATVTVSQSTDAPDGFSNSLKWETTAAGTLGSGSYLSIEQKLEGQTLQQLAFGTTSAKKWTLSFWVKSSITGTYAVSHYSADNSGRIIGATYTVNTANTWEKKTITYDGDTAASLDNDNNESLRVDFHLAANSDIKSSDNTSWTAYSASTWAYGQEADLCTNTGTFYLTGVQLEVGESATEFEHRPYTTELLLCQRYYNLYPGDNYACVYNNSNSFTIFDLPVEMRAVPTIGYSDRRAGASTYYFSSYNYKSRVQLLFAGSVVGYVTNATFDSEL